jgi:hypothetical protein
MISYEEYLTKMSTKKIKRITGHFPLVTTDINFLCNYGFKIIGEYNIIINHIHFFNDVTVVVNCNLISRFLDSIINNGLYPVIIYHNNIEYDFDIELLKDLFVINESANVTIKFTFKI